MRLSRIVLLFALILGLRPAAAAETPAAPATVQFNAVALPVALNGRLINYVFVTIRLDLAPNADSQAVRAKEPFFRDAIVRAGHRAPFTVPTDYTRLDENRMRAEVMSDANVILGRGVVRAVEIVKQVSQHRANLPRPGFAANRPDLIP